MSHMNGFHTHSLRLRPVHMVWFFLNVTAFFNQIAVLQCEQYHSHPYNPFHAMYKNTVALRKNRTKWMGLYNVWFQYVSIQITITPCEQNTLNRTENIFKKCCHIHKNCTVWTSLYKFKFITSNDRSFGCPSSYMDTIHNAFLFIDTSTMLDTSAYIWL